MKNILFSLLLVLVFSFAAFGASSDDVYLRKDVFDAKMDAFMAEIRLGNERLREDLRSEFNQQFAEVNKQFAEIRSDIKVLNEKIDKVDYSLNKRIDDLDSSLNKRIDDSHNFFYLIIVLIGALIALPFIQKRFEQHELLKEKTAPSFTLEDVERLINLRLESLNKTV